MREKYRGWITSCVAAVFLILGSAAAGEAGHSEAGAPYDPRDFTPEQRSRIERLFAQVTCDCPRESWSRTLAGCPDNCADPQKKIIREMVKRGRSDDQILEDQLIRHGGDRRVLSVPDSLLASLFPYLVLGAATVLVVVVLVAKVRRRPGGKSTPGAGPRATESAPVKAAELPKATEEDRLIGEAVERDLQEMDG